MSEWFDARDVPRLERLDDDGPSGITLAEQIGALRKVVADHESMLTLWPPEDMSPAWRAFGLRMTRFERDTEYLRAALRTLQALEAKEFPIEVSD